MSSGCGHQAPLPKAGLGVNPLSCLEPDSGIISKLGSTTLPAYLPALQHGYKHPIFFVYVFDCTMPKMQTAIFAKDRVGNPITQSGRHYSPAGICSCKKIVFPHLKN